MPTATDEDRAQWREQDGSIGEHRPIRFLEIRGFELGPDWYWRLPPNRDRPNEEELSAIYYLVDEWDYGPVLKKARQSPHRFNWSA